MNTSDQIPEESAVPSEVATPEEPLSAETLAAMANQMYQEMFSPAPEVGVESAAVGLAPDPLQAQVDPSEWKIPTEVELQAIPASLGGSTVPNLPATQAPDGLPDIEVAPAGHGPDLSAISSVISVDWQEWLEELPNTEFVAEKFADRPSTGDEFTQYALGDHPFLESKLDKAIGDLEAEELDPRQLFRESKDVGRITTEPANGHGESAYVPDESGLESGFVPKLVPASQPAGGGFNVEALREDFPILKERVHGKRLVWLDNGATTQKPRQVIDRISYFYEHENSNVHRTAHTLAGRATDAYEGAREKIRRFINASSTDEIVYVRGATEGINLIANTFGERNVGEGDEVLISWLEHHANIVPWQMLCARRGAKLKVAPVDDTGQVILSEYERLITPRTKPISFTQVSNALGTITPAAEMIETAHRHGVPVVLDGAQGVLHMRQDVQALDVDFYVFSGHKMFAPTGIGAVYGKKEHLDAMGPWQGGGNMIDCVHFDRTTYQTPPWRFEAGTGNIADAVGLGAAVDYVSAVGIENIARHEHELLEYGTARLLEVPGLRIIGTATNKAAIMSFDLDGHEATEVGTYLDREGIAVRAGHHCAQPILRRFGVESTVRPSLAMYNTREELDRLADALLRLQGASS